MVLSTSKDEHRLRFLDNCDLVEVLFHETWRKAKVLASANTRILCQTREANVPDNVKRLPLLQCLKPGCGLMFASVDSLKIHEAKDHGLDEELEENSFPAKAK